MKHIIVYLQFTSIGEMTTYKPAHGGFIRQCVEYVEPAFGFAVGINFWLSVSPFGPSSCGIFAWTQAIPNYATIVGYMYPSRNHRRRISAWVLATNHFGALGSVYHYLPGSNLPRKRFWGSSSRSCWAFHVVHQMLGHFCSYILHVYHDIWRHSCHKRAYRVPLLEETRFFQQWHQRHRQSICSGSL